MDEVPIRGDIEFGKRECESVRPEKEIAAPVKPEAPLDWRTKAYRDSMPKLSEHHAEIFKMVEDGFTKKDIHKKIGVSRSSLERYFADHEDLLSAWEDAKEDDLDLHEEVMGQLATMDCRMVQTDAGMFPSMDGRALATKFNAAKFKLERLGAKRGWNAKLETNEVGNGGRIPCIIVGDFSEAEIAEGEALVEAANKEAMAGLDGIAHG